MPSKLAQPRPALQRAPLRTLAGRADASLETAPRPVRWARSTRNLLAAIVHVGAADLAGVGACKAIVGAADWPITPTTNVLLTFYPPRGHTREKPRAVDSSA